MGRYLKGPFPLGSVCTHERPLEIQYNTIQYNTIQYNTIQYIFFINIRILNFDCKKIQAKDRNYIFIMILLIEFEIDCLNENFLILLSWSCMIAPNDLFRIFLVVRHLLKNAPFCLIGDLKYYRGMNIYELFFWFH